MAWTKKQLIEQAFAEIGLAPDAFNLTPEDLQRALNSLDAMMATWSAKTIRLGYALPSSPSASELDQDSGLPDIAYEAVFMNLAVRLASGLGKAVSQDTRITAKQAYDAMLVGPAQPLPQAAKSIPSGAGNKPWRNGQPFIPTTSEPLEAAQGGDVIEFT